MLLHKATEFAIVREHEDSENIGMNWVNRWKKRKEVTCKKLHEPSLTIDDEAVTDRTEDLTFPDSHPQERLPQSMPKDSTGRSAQRKWFQTYPFDSENIKITPTLKCSPSYKFQGAVTITLPTCYLPDKSAVEMTVSEHKYFTKWFNAAAYSCPICCCTSCRIELTMVTTGFH
ncbi:unnamed protein product [Clavelina lepadiformis]|uniref:HTH CENPB-type domain-containing protein n=1 Tax=Clavelina lepadiformis TaxID=159417 RepID=A0ABP0GVZ7_CLALP